MDIVILGGFLGSGKTTLLLKLAERVGDLSQKEFPVAILENEIGSVSIDDSLIASKGYHVSTLLSGCACCTLAGELPVAVAGIERDLAPDLLVIEVTGVAIPRTAAEVLHMALGAQSRICVVVDVSRWRRMQVPLEVLLRNQLTGCDVICLNKADLVEPGELSYVQESLDEYDRKASRIITATSKTLSEADLLTILGRDVL